MPFSNLSFRKLTLKDIPRVIEISNHIWEGDDYISYVIEKWIENENCFTFGVFDTNQMVAFSNIRLIHGCNEKIAWLEGGRVDPKFQKKGLGKEIMHYSLEYAKQQGINHVMFDTSSNNKASISIAENYGFKMSEFMHLFFIKKLQINFEKWDKYFDSSIFQVDYYNVYSIYREIQNGPKSNLNIGWSYIPLTIKNLKEINGTWWSNGKSVLLSFHNAELEDRENSKEDEIWIILYGEIDSAISNLKNYLNRIKISEWDNIQVFCHPALTKKMINLGFKYYNETDTDEPRGVILFEKKWKN